jgi:replicative DNA helicase
MSDEQLLFKVLCAFAQVNPNRANDCLLTQAEFNRLESARHEICKLPLAIKDIANVTTERIAAQHKQDIAKYGQAFCVVDYLQLVRSIERKLSREQQVATISRDFKILFKDTKSQGLFTTICKTQIRPGLKLQRTDTGPKVKPHCLSINQSHISPTTNPREDQP